MLRELFVFLGKLYRLVVSLILVMLLTAAAWFMWHFYEDEKLQNRFLKEGQVVQIRVADADVSQHSWRDAFGNINYITFSYNQKNYTVRYVMDTTWVSTGDRIRLLYHPRLDEFRQQHAGHKPGRVVSRLINWSSFNGFNREHKLLIGFLVVATFLFFFAGGVLVTITGWTFLQTIARLILVIVLGITALFFTYDTWLYYRYYQDVKANGRPMEVTVLNTGQHRIGRSTRSSGFAQYTYEASFRYAPGERVIPITEDEYETLKPKDRLRVLYDASRDDFMSATYTAGYGQIIGPLFFWVLFLITGWNTVFKSGKKS